MPTVNPAEFEKIAPSTIKKVVKKSAVSGTSEEFADVLKKETGLPFKKKGEGSNNSISRVMDKSASTETVFEYFNPGIYDAHGYFLKQRELPTFDRKA